MSFPCRALIPTRFEDPDKFEFKGRRLNLGPAMRRVTHNARFTGKFLAIYPGFHLLPDFTIASPSPYFASSLGYAYQTGYPSTPYVVVSPTMPSFVYSPVSPVQVL